MKKTLVLGAVISILAIAGFATAATVTELHPWSGTTVTPYTIKVGNKTVTGSVTGSVSGTITDVDTVPDPVTVTQTVTVTTTVEPPPPTTAPPPTTTEPPPPPPPPPPSGCDVNVPAGSNLANAYAAAQEGQVVCLASGLYPSFTTAGGSKNVTFRGVFPGTVIRGIDVQADNFHLEDVEIKGSDSTDSREWPVGPVLHIAGVQNFTFKNGKVSRARDHMLVLVGGTTSASIHLNNVFEDIEFRDLEFTGLVQDPHGECVYSQSSYLTIKRSTFQNCAVMDLFLTAGTWWGQEPYDGLVLEDNVFWHSTCGGCAGPNPSWHYYSVVQHGAVGVMEDAVVRRNWFENFPSLDLASDAITCDNNVGLRPAGFQDGPDSVPASYKVPC